MSPEFGPAETSEAREFTAAPEAGEEARLLDETYASSSILLKRDVQVARGEAFTAGFTDIDNSYFRHDRAEVSRELADQAEKQAYPLICVTGNDFGGVMHRVDDGQLTRFDIVIGSVGTEIWALQSYGTYKKDMLFEKMLLDSGFDRVTIAAHAAQCMRSINAGNDRLQLQYQNASLETDFLSTADMTGVQPFKLSFHFFAESEDELRQFTVDAATQFPQQELVICEEIGHNSQLGPDDTRKKYCLDIVPVTKAGAVRYVAELLDVQKGIVAGDSGNDTDMLVNSGGLAAIVVGGAKAELLSAVSEKTGNEAKGSFTQVRDEMNGVKAYYVERDANRLGPDSIAHAAKVLLRAERMKKLRDSRNA